MPTGVVRLEVQTEHQESDRGSIDSPPERQKHTSGTPQEHHNRQLFTVTEGETLVEQPDSSQTITLKRVGQKRIRVIHFLIHEQRWTV